MIVIIAGSRDITEYAIVEEAVASSTFNITKVISGGARGVDSLGEVWARKNNIPCDVYPAQWHRYGRSAGPIRNEEMGEIGEALIAIWDGRSRGTAHMIETARRMGLEVYIHSV